MARQLAAAMRQQPPGGVYSLVRDAMIPALALVAALAQAPNTNSQDKPDFSGRWILESSTGAIDAPNTIVVRQLPRGSADAPAHYANLEVIKIERELSGALKAETYPIGIYGGVAGGIDSVGNVRLPPTTSNYILRWDDNRLIIQTRTEARDAQGTVRVTEHNETWSVTDAGRLRLSLTHVTPAGEITTGALVYRRQ